MNSAEHIQHLKFKRKLLINRLREVVEFSEQHRIKLLIDDLEEQLANTDQPNSIIN